MSRPKIFNKIVKIHISYTSLPGPFTEVLLLAYIFFKECFCLSFNHNFALECWCLKHIWCLLDVHIFPTTFHSARKVTSYTSTLCILSLLLEAFVQNQTRKTRQCPRTHFAFYNTAVRKHEIWVLISVFISRGQGAESTAHWPVSAHYFDRTFNIFSCHTFAACCTFFSPLLPL